MASWREILVENSLDAVVGINDDSLVVDWNLQAELIFGWKRDQALGKSVADLLIPPEFRDAHFKGIQHYLKTGIGPILNKRIELQAVHASGNRFSIELSVSPVQTDQGIYFYSFVRDITDRKKAEDTMRATLREKDEFISICSHELKTPITSMKLQYQMAKRLLDNKNAKVHDPLEVEKRVHMTLKQLDKMSTLIEDMLDVTKISLGKLGQDKLPIEVHSLLKEACEYFSLEFETSGVEFSLKNIDKDIFVQGDSYRLEQVISNLITNALKYGNKAPVIMEGEANKDFVIIKVTDHGKGIAPEHIDKIFQRFTRLEAKNYSAGLGLGLYITKAIVKEHEGKIKVESELGIGTTFTIKLPRHYPAPK